MSKKFPAITDLELIKVAKKLGFSFYRQAKGSHEIWYRSSDNQYTTIPRHRGQIIKRRTLKAVMEDLKIKPEKFRQLLKK